MPSQETEDFYETLELPVRTRFFLEDRAGRILESYTNYEEAIMFVKDFDSADRITHIERGHIYTDWAK